MKPQVLEKTIASLEEELKTLKELQSNVANKPKTSSKNSLKGFLRGVNITNEEIEAAKITTKGPEFKSNYTAKDFYGFLKSFKIPEDKLEEELDKVKKLWRF